MAKLLLRRLRSTVARDAQDAYFDAAHASGKILDRLTTVEDPADRGDLLYELADQTRIQMHFYPEAFGPHPLPDEDRDMAEVRKHEALLYRLLADVEMAVANRRPRRLNGSWLEPHAGQILDRMAGTDDPLERGGLLFDLTEAVTPHVGAEAAMAVAGLPAPGHQQIRTLRQILSAAGQLILHRMYGHPLRIAVPLAVAAVLLGAVSFPLEGAAGVLATIGATACGAAVWTWWWHRRNLHKQYAETVDE